MLTVEKRKIGINEDGTIEIIDLKERPDKINLIVDGKIYLPGYHMNKKHWITIPLDYSMSNEKLFAQIDNSYNLAR